jgi:hypothetical protein
VIRTDHINLCHIQDQTLATDMQKKAMTKLAGLQFSVQYKKGTKNKAADALSRVANNMVSTISATTHV